LLGSDWEGLGIGLEIELGLGIVIADLNQIDDLKLSILAPVNSDGLSEPNTVLIKYRLLRLLLSTLNADNVLFVCAARVWRSTFSASWRCRNEVSVVVVERQWCYQ